MSGGGSKKKVTVGHWYGLGAQLVLCHGPVDAVTEIRVGERVAWSGQATSTTTIGINRLDLFGGEDREGGVEGSVDILMGEPSQGRNAYLQERLGADIPAFRGVVSLVLKRVWVAAMNPYIKPWSVRARRTPRGWYEQKAAIGADANPAHIIRECLTNADWGMGYPAGDMDEASFRAAADTLHAEGFGLSLLWSQEETIESFVLSVLKHVDGVLYVHPRSGLFVLQLARADYQLDRLPIFDPSNILRIEEFTRPSWGETVNQVTVVYRDAASDKDASVTVQDIAAVQLNGGVVATSLQYPGISHGALATRVAMRELKQLSASLAKCTFIANRQAAALQIGGVVKLSWPPYGIEQLPMRIVRTAYGELASGAVRVDCVQDIFGLPQSVYSAPPPSGWKEPTSEPLPCPQQALFEVPYWWIVQDLTGESDSRLGDIGDLDGLVAVCGSRPSGDAFGFKAMARVGGGWEDKGQGSFTPTAILAVALPPSGSQVRVSLANGIGLEDVEAGGLALVNGEWLKVASLDRAGAGEPAAVFERGLLDTVPVGHPAGSRVWFAEEARHYLQPEYVQGETVRARLLTQTARGTLPLGEAPEMSLTLAKRFIRPYCPGNPRVNSRTYPAAVAGEIIISWATRNRRTQTAYLVLQTEGEITPEAGQTTTVRFYGETGSLRRTLTGLAGNSVTWPLAQELADSGLGRVNAKLRVEIESLRDGHVSWQKHSIEFERAGYGLHYGNYYGGV
ncbi:phage tail protein [Aquabacterium sp. A7-Y]|uniref:phage tail protein n=1 Tax=Aquabacterium sp. A7-Y TaxID=1349605 RepID=UPI00223CB92F|nr:phage tail protein [Aquabacterium sp. A7-Y]MCW7536704.1 phage tail protein [Aquabacterium sp. A7-Y]